MEGAYLLDKSCDDHLANSHTESRKSLTSTFTADEDDIQQINGVRIFFKNFFAESVKLWYLAGPAIFTSVSQFSLGAITQVFTGHVGTVELAAVSMENSLIAGSLSASCAPETLCGQAYGAGELNLLGIYMQRSWIIILTASLPLMLLYIFAGPILSFIGQTTDISKWSGIFAIWMIPQLFAYAANFPIQKFLQSQSKIFVMAAISGIGLVLHIFFSWLLMLKLGWGLVGAAAALNASWWFIVIAQLLYIFSGTCGQASSGFSWKAFQNLRGFVRLSLASGLMLCLESWYFMVLIPIAGYLKNAEIAVDGLSICMNLQGWTVMVAFGFNAALSVRVSNELGAGHPKAAKFSVVVVTITSLIFKFFNAVVLMLVREQYPALFSDSEEVQQLVYEFTPLLSITIFINNVQPTLSGVAIGAGWQAYVAYVNIVCYHILGIPFGLILSFIFDMSAEGIWYGMLTGTMVQTCVLLWMIIKTDWNKEASIAGDRIKHWGGEKEPDRTIEFHIGS